MSLQIRINENVTVSRDRNQEDDKGLIIKLQHDLYLIFKTRIKENEEKEYGFYLVNPWTREGSNTSWGLTEAQCCRFINKVIKNPYHGYGKNKEAFKKVLLKIANKIKKTNVKHKLHKGSSSSKGYSKRQSKNGINFKKTNKNKPSKRRNCKS